MADTTAPKPLKDTGFYLIFSDLKDIFNTFANLKKTQSEAEIKKDEIGSQSNNSKEELLLQELENQRKDDQEKQKSNRLYFMVGAGVVVVLILVFMLKNKKSKTPEVVYVEKTEVKK